MTGEQIKRVVAGGELRIHRYYKCGNDAPPEGHPKSVRIKEDHLDDLVLAELEAMRIPNPEVAQHIRGTLVHAFEEVAKAEALRKRKTAVI